MAQAILSEPVSTGNGLPGAMPILSLVNGKPRASSIAVAEHFKKRHDNVMRAITQTCHHLPSNFCTLNFEETSITVPGPKGGSRQERAYLMTRDGFTLIVMGFTGKEAMAWKLRYIEAFNAMEAELARQQAPANPAVSTVITPAQQQELQNIVAAKASVFPKEALGRVRAQIWSRLHNKFKVAKYDQLPHGAFPEAVEYLVGLEVRGAFPAALPTDDEPKALPAARTRNTLDDYKALYRDLPGSPKCFMDLLTDYAKAHDALAHKLEEVKAQATKPFRVNRKSGIATYFDEAMSPMYSLFDAAERNQHLAYCNIFDALNGCRNIWLLLNKG